MGVWRRHREAASAGLSAAPYSAHHKLYSEAVVSSAVALAEVGRFGEAVEYVQKAAKTLYEGAREVFERVKVSLQRLAELFVEAVTRVLAWVDEYKAYLFLRAAVAAGVMALGVALNLWGHVELEKLAHFAMGLTSFAPGGVERYSREEAFSILKNAPDPYEKFKEIVKEANVGRVKLAEPWESLRMLIGRAHRELDEGKKALFYAALALGETFGAYRTALRKYAEGLKKAVQKRKGGEEPLKQDMYVVDLKQIKQLAEDEGKAFENALKTLRERLNEYADWYGLGDLLNVKEGKARELAEAKRPELSEFNDVSFGVKAYAALIAYREYALGRRGAFGAAAGYWLEMGGSAWLLYYAPSTAYVRAERAEVERPVAVEEMLAEALRRLFPKPGADHYHSFVEELTKGGKLALMLEKKAKSKKTESYVFRLFRLEEGGGLVELGIELWISRVGEGEGVGITYTLIFDAERWRDFFRPELEAGVKAAEVVGGRLPVGDSLPYMLGWVDSDVAITRKKKDKRVLEMSTSHLWQFAETYALLGWSDAVRLRMSLTLEGPKLQVMVEAPLEKLDEAIRKSAEGGWLKILGIEAGSWDDLKGWVVENWDIVVEAAVKRLGEGVRSELEALRDRLNDDKVAREVVAPALLLMQAERLGVDETALRYFGAFIYGAIGGDGSVSAAEGKVVLASGKREIALLWATVLAAHGIKAKVRDGRGFDVVASGDDAARLAGLYFLYGAPLLEGDDRLKSHKLAEAMKLAAEGLDIRWEELRRRTEDGLVAADLIISVGGAAVKYDVYLRENGIKLQFASTDRNRVELAARLLRLAGVGAEVKKEGGRDVWYVHVYTNKLAAGRNELRDALAEFVREAVARGWVDASKAEGWLKKLEKGLDG